jgi:hypothetical protein
VEEEEVMGCDRRYTLACSTCLSGTVLWPVSLEATRRSPAYTGSRS